MTPKTYADVLQYFLDMEKFADFAIEALGDGTAESLKQDWRIELQVTRALEMLGEATRGIPSTVKEEFPTIPWHVLMGLRNVLAHEYGSIDLEIIHGIVTRELPPLRVAIRNARQVIEGKGASSLP